MSAGAAGAAGFGPAGQVPVLRQVVAGLARPDVAAHQHHGRRAESAGQVMQGAFVTDIGLRVFDDRCGLADAGGQSIDAVTLRIVPAQAQQRQTRHGLDEFPPKRVLLGDRRGRLEVGLDHHLAGKAAAEGVFLAREDDGGRAGWPGAPAPVFGTAAHAIGASAGSVHQDVAAGLGRAQQVGIAVPQFVPARLLGAIDDQHPASGAFGDGLGPAGRLDFVTDADFSLPNSCWSTSRRLGPARTPGLN